MAEEAIDSLGYVNAAREQAAALVRAIRRAYGSPGSYGGLERFTVTDIHDFARRLVEQGVTAPDDSE
jgi:hypothetical protein